MPSFVSPKSSGPAVAVRTISQSMMRVLHSLEHKRLRFFPNHPIRRTIQRVICADRGGLAFTRPPRQTSAPRGHRPDARDPYKTCRTLLPARSRVRQCRRAQSRAVAGAARRRIAFGSPAETSFRTGKPRVTIAPEAVRSGIRYGFAIAGSKK